MPRHLILGGARSGKSALAERLARDSGLPVTVIATAQAGDGEMRARIARHRAERPSDWHTVEAPLKLAETLAAHASPGGCLIVDCLTLWLTNQLLGALAPLPRHDNQEARGLPDGLYDAADLPAYARARAALLATLPTLPGTLLLVANEVGLGLVPDTGLGRLFRDEAGRLNQAVASVCEDVSLVAAGLTLPLKRAGLPSAT